MTSDNMDEDANLLDDEALLEAYLNRDRPKSGPAEDGATALPDWPRLVDQDLRLPIDAETLAWFKANYVDWRQAMASILRAWTVARTKS